MLKESKHLIRSTVLAVICLASTTSAQEDARIRGEAMLRALDRVCSHFEANRGQLDDRVDFAFRSEDYRLDLLKQGIGLGLTDTQMLLGPPMQITFLNAPGSTQGLGREELPFGVMHRVSRNGVRRHLTRIPTYRSVEYKNMYDGIDVKYHIRDDQFEYDFVVAPNADPSQIELGLEGVREAILDAEGNLRMLFPVAELVQHKPQVYQVIEGHRVSVDGRYEIQGDRRVTIVVGAYDVKHPLIIDPLISVKVKTMDYGLLSN